MRSSAWNACVLAHPDRCACCILPLRHCGADIAVGIPGTSGTEGRSSATCGASMSTRTSGSRLCQRYARSHVTGRESESAFATPVRYCYPVCLLPRTESYLLQTRMSRRSLKCMSSLSKENSWGNYCGAGGGAAVHLPLPGSGGGVTDLHPHTPLAAGHSGAGRGQPGRAKIGAAAYKLRARPAHVQVGRPRPAGGDPSITSALPP